MAAEITQPANALAYCRDKAAPPGSSLHYALLFEPEETRPRLLALFALHYEVTETLTASSDPGVIRIKLNWWQEEITRMVEGNPRHPVTMCLWAGLDRNQDIPRLQQYLATIESIASGRLAERLEDEWRETLIQGLGLLCTVAGHHDAKGPELERIQSSGGTVFALELLQNSLPLLTRGYRLFPDSLLEKHHLTLDALLIPADSPSPLYTYLIKQIAERLDRDYAALRKNTAGSYPLILNRLARALCEEIAADGYQLLRHRIALTPLRKFWIAIRTHYLG